MILSNIANLYSNQLYILLNELAEEQGQSVNI